MIGQATDELRLEERINRGGIILVNLNKGLLGANESRLLGVLLTMQKPFTPEQIQELPNFHALVRLLDEHGPIGPLVMKTLKV